MRTSIKLHFTFNRSQLALLRTIHRRGLYAPTSERERATARRLYSKGLLTALPVECVMVGRGPDVLKRWQKPTDASCRDHEWYYGLAPHARKLVAALNRGDQIAAA